MGYWKTKQKNYMMLTINLLRNSLGMQKNQRICPKKGTCISEFALKSIKVIITSLLMITHIDWKACSPPPLQECSHNDKWSRSCAHTQLSTHSIYGDLRTYEWSLQSSFSLHNKTNPIFPFRSECKHYQWKHSVERVIYTYINI